MVKLYVQNVPAEGKADTDLVGKLMCANYFSEVTNAAAHIIYFRQAEAAGGDATYITFLLV